MRSVRAWVLVIGALAAVACQHEPERLPPLAEPKRCLAPPVSFEPPSDFIAPDSGEGPAGRFKVGPRHFAVWDGSTYRDLFVRGMDIGASQPGSGPNDLTATYEDYRCWLQLLGASGINAVRLYVPHFPTFYDALADHNTSTPEHAIYLLQGSYLSEAPEGSTVLDLYQHEDKFDDMLTTLVDIVHGRADVEPAPRSAYGHYDTDVSAWTLGWIVGREVEAAEALETNAKHPDASSFEGARLRMRDASATEVFMSARLDHLVDYELREYGTSRPFAWSNWLELDPIEHPTEGSNSQSDRVAVDFAKLEVLDAPAGHFVSYHVYPYYPNFVNEDPGYRELSDEEGPNSFLGILGDLRRHHHDQALFIAEFGVPSSWGRAHSSFSGMHHGGLSEDQQGHYGARMARNIASIGAAGFAYFQLTDGWWKHIWITAAQTIPLERLRYWHDMLNAQQHYGLIGFELEPPDWEHGQVATGAGEVRELRVRYDAEFVHMRVDLRRPLSESRPLVIGLDTYDDRRGERVLPNGTRTRRPSEFALTVTAAGKAEVQVLRSYDLRNIRDARPPEGAQFCSTASDSSDWISMEWVIAKQHGSDDGKYWFPDDIYPIGALRVADPDAPSSLDAVTVQGDRIVAKIPWTLLNFAEPGRHGVIDDDVRSAAREVAVTPGIAFAVSVGHDLLETERLGWKRWTRAPQTRERLKASAGPFFEGLRDLPLWLDGDGDPDATD